MSISQQQEVNNYKSNLLNVRQVQFADKLQEILDSYGRNKRQAFPVLNAIVVDTTNPKIDCFYMLEVWNPDEGALELIQEDTILHAYNVVASASW